MKKFTLLIFLVLSLSLHAQEEESLGILQGVADNFFSKSKKEAKASEEDWTKKDNLGLQNWVDKQLNQGKHNPEVMSEQKRTEHKQEEVRLERQRKIDHEKPFSLQNIFDKWFDQGDYAPKK